MTVSSTTRKAGPFNGNGSTTAYPFEFKVFTKADLLVVHADADGQETTLELDSDYSVTLNADQDNNPGGTITYPMTGDALPAGETLTATTNVAELQATDIINASGFLPRVIEDAFDRATILVQQVSEKVDRSLQLALSTPDGVSTVLPAPEAQKVLAWDEGASRLVNRAPEDFASIAAFAQWQSETFDGDGVATSFVLSSDPGNINNLDISIDRLAYRPNLDFSLSGSTVTFTTPPAAGTDNVLVRWGQALPQGIADAIAVYYSQGGSGSRTRLTQDRLRERASLLDYAPIADGALEADGRTGTGTGTDVTTALQNAFNAVAAAGGGVLFVPYCGTGIWRLDGEVTGQSNVHLVIDHGVGFDCKNKASGSASIKWIGSAGPEVPISTNITRGDYAINTTTLHGMAVGDWGLLKSQRDCLHADATDQWRLGETTGSGSPCYFAEPFQVETAASVVNLTTTRPLIFPDYKVNAAAETSPNARAAATVQRLSFIDRPRVTGGRFFGGGATILRFEFCFEPRVDHAEFYMGVNAGIAVRAECCYRPHVEGKVWHATTNYIVGDHSSYNSFKDVGCWWGEWHLTDFNGSQGVDVSREEVPSLHPTIHVKSFDALESGFTFHSGSYGGRVVSPLVVRPKNTGGYIRSRGVQVDKPYLYGPDESGSRSGLLFEAWGIDTQVTGGTIEGFFRGIRTKRTGDTETGPATRNQIFDGLTVRRCNTPVFLEGADSSPETTARSGIRVSNLNVQYCESSAVSIAAYVNYVDVDGVEASDPTTSTTNGIAVRSAANAVGTRIRNITGSGLGSSQVLVQSLAITDTVTFPAATYPTNRVDIDEPSIKLIGSGTPVSISTSVGGSLNNRTQDYTLNVFDGCCEEISMNAAVTRTITIPTNATVPLPIRTTIRLRNVGAGLPVIAPAVGVTLNSAVGLTLRATNSLAYITKTSSDTWYAWGDLVP